MAVYRKKIKTGKTWCIDYRVNGARVRKTGFETKKKAEDALTRIKNAIIDKTYALPKDEKIRFSEFALKYMREYSKPIKREMSFKADKFLLKNLNEYFGDFYIDDITGNHFDIYRSIRIKQKVKGRERKLSPTTINREGALLRGILNKAVEWDCLTLNPIKKMKMYTEEPRERILSRAEIDKLISSADAHLKSIILIALNTGMRLGEILKLEWSRIYLDLQNQDDSYIRVTKTKTGKKRDVFMNQTMIELFSRLRLKRAGSDYVFPNPSTGKPLTTVKTAWQNLLKRAKIKGFRFHDLRHCFATYSLLMGGDILSLQDTLGHASISTTRKYLKPLKEGKQQLMKGFEVSDKKFEKIDLIQQKKQG